MRLGPSFAFNNTHLLSPANAPSFLVFHSTFGFLPLSRDTFTTPSRVLEALCFTQAKLGHLKLLPFGRTACRRCFTQPYLLHLHLNHLHSTASPASRLSPSTVIPTPAESHNQSTIPFPRTISSQHKLHTQIESPAQHKFSLDHDTGLPETP